jgi:hypothetical protein
MKGLVVAHSSSCGALQVPSDGRQARARVASDRPLRTEYIPDLGSADHSSFPGIIPPSLSLSIAIAIPKTVRSRASSPAPHDVVYRDQAIPQFHSIPNAQPHPRHLNTSRSPVAYSHAQPQAQSQPYQTVEPDIVHVFRHQEAAYGEQRSSGRLEGGARREEEGSVDQGGSEGDLGGCGSTSGESA